MIIPFYRQKSRGTERSRHSPKVTQLHFLRLSPQAFLTEMNRALLWKGPSLTGVSMSSLNLTPPSPPHENRGVGMRLRAGLVV